MNLKNLGNEQPGGSGGFGGSKPPENMLLTRQPSVYSLTFDEFQSSMGGIGKDLGSMNMDELLKNIWTAEETQAMASFGACGGAGAGAGVGAGVGGGGNGVGIGQEGLRRQGSLTLPRTLSQKTVDEVWRDISKDYGVAKSVSGIGASNMPQRQPTLGQMTIEEFFARAGILREESQFGGDMNNGAFLTELSHQVNNANLGIGFQQAGRSNMLGDHALESNNQVSVQSSNMPLTVNGVRSNQSQQPVQHNPSQQQIFPKQTGFGYAAQMPLPGSAQLGGSALRGGIVGAGEHGITATGLVQTGALQSSAMGVVALGGGAVMMQSGSPSTPLSSDGVGRSNGDTSSASPVPYMFREMRGKKSSGTAEKAIERRQRRMIKNRESAARSRARKQAHTLELEAEVAKLKEENQELKRKQAEMLEMQKSQVKEAMNHQSGPAKRLRRTQTGPW